MRTFIALDIDESIRARIALFINGIQGFADVRWVRPESLHVTLKFIGEKPEEAVAQIQHALGAVTALPFELTFRGHGFFPTAKSPRVFWLGIEAGPQLAALAAKIDTVTEQLGIERETRPYSPHLTLARAPGASGAPGHRKGDNPNRRFARLQEQLARMPAPEFGTMTAREFFLYQSKLGRGGSQYTKIARFGL